MLPGLSAGMRFFHALYPFHIPGPFVILGVAKNLSRRRSLLQFCQRPFRGLQHLFRHSGHARHMETEAVSHSAFHQLSKEYHILSHFLDCDVEVLHTVIYVLQVVEFMIMGCEKRLCSVSVFMDIFHDCTGDGDLAYMAQVPMQSNPDGELQPSSFCFILSGVDTDSELLNKCMYHNGINGPSQCRPVREKLLAMKAAGVEMPDFGGPWFNNVMHRGSVAVNMTRRAADSTNNRNFTAAECQLREDIFTFTKLLKENFKEFKDCYVASTAPQAGIRESRRIVGVHTVTADEYVSAFQYEDSISRGIHPIDIHASKGTSQVRIDLEKPAYVPYRALIAPDYPNLLVAGRCISTDRQALASLRVMASCMGTGQAAGAAAAQCVANNQTVHQIDAKVLVETVRRLGAIV